MKTALAISVVLNLVLAYMVFLGRQPFNDAVGAAEFVANKTIDAIDVHEEDEMEDSVRGDAAG